MLRYKRRKKDRKLAQEAIEEHGSAAGLIASNIGLPLYQKYVELGLHDKLERKIMNEPEVADLLECALSTVYRLKEYALQDVAYQEVAAQFQPDEWARDLLEDFPGWREAFFEVRAGVPYVTTDFHQTWINQGLKVLETGGRGLILSPPRHGKTDLLIHFVVWLILRDPDISIMWVSKNSKVAKRSIHAVKQLLEHHEQLRKTYLPPGQFWKPDRRTGLKWDASEIYVANASVVGQKSPTLQGIGARASIINQDVDVMICDDIEDSKSTLTEGSRQETRNWWVTDIGSRIMTHSAIFVIGSRQHADDLYSRLLTNPGWDKIVEHAHDPDCPLPQHPLNDHVDCMLWPDMNSYEWLMTQRIEADATGGRKLYEMVYQNTVERWSTVIFQRPHLEACRNFNRTIGKFPSGVRLVAGLDPAVTGFQAAVLWGMDPKNEKQYLIDIDNSEGGGAPKALSLMQQWNAQYGLAHWVIEENGWQAGYAKDRDIISFTQRNGVRIEGHETRSNKYDPRFGLKAMADLFEDQIMDLPYGDVDSQAIIDQFIHQAVLVEPGVKARSGSGVRGIRSDIVMAGWFPQKEWRRLIRKQLAGIAARNDQYDPIYRDYDPYTEVAV